jgi:hypothetical protein
MAIATQQYHHSIQSPQKRNRAQEMQAPFPAAAFLPCIKPQRVSSSVLLQAERVLLRFLASSCTPACLQEGPAAGVSRQQPVPFHHPVPKYTERI